MSVGLLAPVSVILLTILISVYVNNPAPPLTPNLEKWKKQGQYLEFNNNQIFYIDFSGKGTSGTLICFHGYPSSSYDWTKILHGLREKFNRVIVLDFLGFGFSDKPSHHGYTISEQADISLYLLESLQEKKVHILSHDIGDTVALEVLARYNEYGKVGNGIKLQTLSMLNGGIFQETLHPRIIQKILMVPVIGPVIGNLMFYQAFERGFAEIFGTNKPTSEEMWEFWVSIRYKDGHSVLPRLLAYLPERTKYNERWVGALKHSKIPVQMIYGPADPVNPPAFINHFRKTVPQHQLVDLDEEIGHYPQWETPDKVLNAYLHFIENSKA